MENRHSTHKPFGDERQLNLAPRAKQLNQAAIHLAAKNPLRVFSCSLWDNHHPWFVPRRILPDNFCLFVIFGKLQLILDDSEYVLNPGNCFLLSNGIPHAFGLPPGERNVKHFIFHAYPQNGFLANPVNCLKTPFHQHSLTPLEIELLKDTIALFQCGIKSVLSYCDIFLNKLLMEIAMQDGFKPEIQTASNSRVAAAVAFAEQHYETNIGVPDMAAAAGIKEVQCRKLFRQHLNMTPAEFLLQLRLSHAVRMLLNTKSSIREITLKCGFSDASYFCYVFRKHLNHTPENYRQIMFKP